MNSADISRALTRISHEILERNSGSDNLVILGIPTGGAHLANRISKSLSEIEGKVIATGTLDITLHRDDLRTRPPRPLMPTNIPNDGIEGKDVVLVDDVLFSGRTIRAALDALGEIGRPRTVQLAVLVDRGHRELPIEARYVGRMVQTSSREIIEGKINEIDSMEKVLLVERVD